ncbi:DUF3530 family protein [uncultured Pseudoteredinibacter sp.]|uniref:DUF3530 family protein n=1 Tax=uncultured Pseudoteredinibacter sp. TaxID=1641701 RepID=UPI002632064D|nr:DUF3530 family protein [uncultured Pseudoteredinibacter sp.]
MTFATDLFRKALLCLLLSSPFPTWAQEDTQTSPEPQAEQNGGEKPSPAPAPAAIERPKLDKQHIAMQSMAALAQASDPDTVLWLGEGADSFLAIYQAAWQPVPNGAAIILHADGQHALWPETSKVLSENLAKHGWTSLSISLPEALAASIPQRQYTAINNAEEGDKTPTEVADTTAANEAQATPENTTANAEATMAEESTLPTPESVNMSIDPETQAFERLMESYEYLRQQGLLNIAIICEGSAAVRAVKMISAIPLPAPSNPQARVANPVAALVSINAIHNLPRDADFKLPTALAELNISVLDIYFDDSEHSKRDAEKRKAEAARAGLAVYRQQRLPLNSSKLAQGENPLSKRVRGFLNRYVRGRAKTLP